MIRVFITYWQMNLIREKGYANQECSSCPTKSVVRSGTPRYSLWAACLCRSVSALDKQQGSIHKERLNKSGSQKVVGCRRLGALIPHGLTPRLFPKIEKTGHAGVSPETFPVSVLGQMGPW